MTSAVTVASPQTSLQEAMVLMKKLGVPVIVVYDGKRLVGLITDRDLALSHRIREASVNATIKEFMRTDVRTSFEDDRLCDALSLMQDSDGDWLPVLDRDHRLVGALSRYAAP